MVHYYEKTRFKRTWANITACGKAIDLTDAKVKIIFRKPFEMVQVRAIDDSDSTLSVDGAKGLVILDSPDLQLAPGDYLVYCLVIKKNEPVSLFERFFMTVLVGS